MKTIALISVFVFSLSNLSAQNMSYSEEELLQMSIFELCEALDLPAEYNARYQEIILPLCSQGVIIFDGSLNPYVTEDNYMDIQEYELSCYKYVGTAEQNAKLVRNIVKNRHLFKDGKLTDTADKKWVIVN